MSGAHCYLIALGSNRRHHRFGLPEKVLVEAAEQLAQLGGVEAVAPILATAPVGPSQRHYANGAVVLAAPLTPPKMLAAVKVLERSFGRKAGGQRWSARVLDCDIVLWSGGRWQDRTLTIPHPAFRQRQFVLAPARAIAADWRDPATGLRIRHLQARLTKPRPVIRWAPPKPDKACGPLAQ